MAVARLRDTSRGVASRFRGSGMPLFGMRVPSFPGGGSSLALGPNLVVNGAFAADTDWTKGAGWTIAGGVGVATAVAPGVRLEQIVTLLAGVSYEITFNLVTVTAGGAVVVILGNGDVGNVNGTQRTSPGTYTETLTAGSVPVAVGIYAGGTFSGTIDNFSVRKWGVG